MNRIVLIGNGFDLAHGLPTQYVDFINWYWDRLLNQLRRCTDQSWEDGLCSLKVKNWRTLCSFFGPKAVEDKTQTSRDIIYEITKNETAYVTFVISSFFEYITRSVEEKGWVDIENEYYTCLSTSTESNDNKSVKELNDELDHLRLLLAEYLNTVQTAAKQRNIFCEGIQNVLSEPIRPEEIAISSTELLDSFIKERVKFNRGKWEAFLDLWNKELTTLDYHSSLDKIEEDFNKEGVEGIRNRISWNKFLLPDRMLMLNFNYTSIADDYLSWDKEKYHLINHIHGQLSDPNGMIFGYGDELDSGYKGMLQRNDNEYLRNIKSIKYLETDNYRKVLSFIESAPYQIYIMGHSCGNSDRTLLNTLFEHKNCVSIKPFYYKREDGSDTYMEIVQNISRNFTDMKLMRDRVVNKTYCDPLPQYAPQ